MRVIPFIAARETSSDAPLARVGVPHHNSDIDLWRMRRRHHQRVVRVRLPRHVALYDLLSPSQPAQHVRSVCTYILWACCVFLSCRYVFYRAAWMPQRCSIHESWRGTPHAMPRDVIVVRSNAEQVGDDHKDTSSECCDVTTAMRMMRRAALWGWISCVGMRRLCSAWC